MKRPIDLAIEQYKGSSRVFHEDLTNHMYGDGGYVYTGPDAFIMARTINSRFANMWDEWRYFKHENPDCWFVFLAAGKAKLHRFQELAPFKLPLIGWHRRTDNNIRTYDWDRFATLAKRNGINKSQTTTT